MRHRRGIRRQASGFPPATALLTLLITHASAGANEPIAPNELGTTAIDCATNYCNSKDSLLLWLSLENSCFNNKQPYFASDFVQTTDSSHQRERSTLIFWSLNVAGAFAGIAMVIGLMVGYVAGKAYGDRRLPIA